jgi:hypothetical protein
MSLYRVGVETVEQAAPVGFDVVDVGLVAARAAALRAGRDGATGDDKTSENETQASVMSTLTKWIPSEVLALYMFGIGAVEVPGEALLVVGAIGAMALPYLSGWSKDRVIAKAKRRLLAIKGALAIVAFLIWSLLVPAGLWQKFSWVSDNAGLVALIALSLAMAFPLVAEGVTMRYDPDRPRPATPAPKVG